MPQSRATLHERRCNDAVLEQGVRHGPALQGFARRLGLSEDQAQDAAQEVLVRLLRALDAGTPIADPRAWLFHALYRVAMDQHRIRVRTIGLRERLLGTGPRIVAEEPDHAGRISIWATVDRLPARQRQILYLRYRADLSFEDIGSVLHITASSARATASKALERLRLLLGPESER